MGYLFLTILMNVVLFACFRSYPRYRIDTFPAIVINYYVCVLTGSILSIDKDVFPAIQSGITWLIPALILGFVFILTFVIMARTTQVFNISVASIASKMSLVIPVVFSLFIFGIESKTFSFINYAGIFVALFAIVLSSIREETTHIQHTSNLIVLSLPLMVFILNGILDTTMNYANNYLLSESLQPVFPVVIFAMAAIIGSIILLFRNKRIKLRYFAGGIILGIPNYFSVFFLLKGLSEFSNNGAVYFPVLNVGIILFSSLAAFLFFKEKLLRINRFGMVLSITAILMLSYQELFVYFKGIL